MKSFLPTILAAVTLLSFSACSREEAEPEREVKPEEKHEEKQTPEVKQDGAGEGGEKPDFGQIKKEIEAVIGAVFRADMAAIEKHTHERVIAIVGDKATFLAEMKKVFGQFAEQGIVLISAEAGGEIEYFAGTNHEFVLVPTTITFKVGEEEQDPAPGHQLGVKKRSEDVWKYIDCSSMTTEMAREWFPDFPEDKELPKAE